MMNILSIGLSGLNAASLRASTAASNIANVSTSGALEGTIGPRPYETRIVAQTTTNNGGVTATVLNKNPGFVAAFDPGSPFADGEGKVGVPNTDMAEEIINLKLAETSYRASLKTIEAAGELTDDLLNIFDERA